MANQFASLSAALGILKNWYAGPIVTQFNDAIPLYRDMEKGKEKFSGLQVIRPLKLRRNQGVGATSDGGTLPKIGHQGTAQAAIGAKFNYLRFGVTGPMLKASQGDKGAFVSAMEFEMEQGLIDLKNDINRQLFFDGSGTIATVAANASSSTVITVTGRTSNEDGSKYLDIGKVVDVYTAAGALVVSGVGITGISGTSTATLTLDTAVSVSATDVLVSAGAKGQEIQGLRTSLDGLTTSIYGIDRSVYPAYQGNVVNAASAQLTLDLMQRTINEARRRGGAKIDAIFCDFNSDRFYNKLLIADKRYQGKVKGDGSFTNKDESYLEFAGAPVIPDKDCPQEMYFLDSKVLKKYVLSELEWADETGAYLIAQTSADAFEARLRLFANMFPEKPSALARLHTYISP